jgi:hypothetical protein
MLLRCVRATRLLRSAKTSAGTGTDCDAGRPPIKVVGSCWPPADCMRKPPCNYTARDVLRVWLHHVHERAETQSLTDLRQAPLPEPTASSIALGRESPAALDSGTCRLWRSESGASKVDPESRDDQHEKHHVLRNLPLSRRQGTHCPHIMESPPLTASNKP